MADWNYTADLDLAKDGLSRISEPDKARNLVKALLSLKQNSTLELESGPISESFSEQASDESQDKYQKPLDWNYAAEFIQRLMGKMPKLTRKRREQIQHLMATCLTLAEESDPVDMLNNSLDAEKLNLTESQVISYPRPFEIPELFNKILSYCPLDTLLTCRLINQYWNQNSVHWIQEKHKESVDICSDLIKFWTESTKILLVTKLELYLDDFSLDQDTEFLIQHGSFIRKLEIIFFKGSQDDEMLGLKKLKLVLRHVPNLRSLRLYVSTTEWENFSELSTVKEEVIVILPRVESLELNFEGSLSKEFLDGFFTMLPNVGIINVEDFRNGRTLDWKQFWTSVPKNIHTAGIAWIKNPDFWIAMTKECSLKLKSVTMELMDLEILEAQREFLMSQSENLEVLSLYGSSGLNRTQFRLHLPVFKNLESAKFHYWINYNDRDGNLVVPLQPAQLPKLKHLGVTPEFITSGLSDSLFPSVQEINFIRRRFNFDFSSSLPLPQTVAEFDYRSILPQIVAKFPNLRKVSNIEITADVEDMESIFKNLGNIEDLELRIVDGEGTMKNFNLALSGFPGQVEPKCILTQLAHRVGYESLPLWIDPPRPSLRDLKNLKRLVLEFEPRTLDLTARVRIDEISVYMTFLRMSPELCLILQGDFLIPEKLAGMLTAHYRNIYFMPSDSAPERERILSMLERIRKYRI